MSHRPAPAVQVLLAALTALLLLIRPDLAWGQVRVEAQLSSEELPSPQPVELTLSAVSGDGPVGNPDLSVLEPDFQILDRRVERRVSVTNGKRREEVRLRLIVLPRRAGELELPGIAFDSARSEPLRLTVKGEATGLGGPADPTRAPSAPLLDPEVFEPPGISTPHPFTPGYYPDWSSSLLSGPGPVVAPFPPSTTGPGLDSLPLRAPEPAAATSPRAPLEPAEASAGTFGNPWFWISLALAAALAGVLGRRRSRAGVQRPDRVSGTTGEEAAPPDPLESAVETVRAAYQRGDGSGAREALLNWGRLRWPQDPPGNLARLARRVPPPLRDHITQLEKAFFSPEPIHWERDPVPEELLAQSPPRVQVAAVA